MEFGSTGGTAAGGGNETCSGGEEGITGWTGDDGGGSFETTISEAGDAIQVVNPLKHGSVLVI